MNTVSMELKLPNAKRRKRFSGGLSNVQMLCIYKQAVYYAFSELYLNTFSLGGAGDSFSVINIVLLELYNYKQAAIFIL